MVILNKEGKYKRHCTLTPEQKRIADLDLVIERGEFGGRFLAERDEQNDMTWSIEDERSVW